MLISRRSEANVGHAPAAARLGFAAAVLGLLGLVAGCATPAASESAPAVPSEGATGAPGAALPIRSCADVQAISAPAGWYRPTPVYVGNEMPVDEVLAWAAERPGFVELWIDRDRQGWVTVGFERDAGARQAELLAAFPGVGVVAVDVPYTAAELDRLAGELTALGGELGISSITPAVHRGVVEVDLGVLRPDRVLVLAARFPGAPLCVSGIDPADAPQPGPQLDSGDGWRLLGHADPAGPGYRTGIAAGAEAYAALWAEAGLAGDLPDVDFELEVVLWFGAVTGSSCPDLRLDGIVVDADRALLYPQIVNAQFTGACTADLYPHSFVVAFDRERLPAPPFAIQLQAEDPPAGMPEERTVVDADLSLPGAVPDPGQVHPDPALLDPEPVAAEPGDSVEPGFETPFRFPIACGVEWLGPLNDTWWRTTDAAAAAGQLPDGWAGLVADDGTLTARISMSAGAGPGQPASLLVTVGDRTLRYAAMPGRPACP